MSETESAPRHGRRARRLSPEEAAAQEALAAQAAESGEAPETGEHPPVEPATESEQPPAVRGAVAPPSAEEPMPTLRRFGKRARIIELAEGEAPAGDAEPTGAAALPEGGSPVVRDQDGVELGELTVSEAPDPRPAPRYDGKVLQRPERSGGKPLLWVVWVLIALALVALVVLLLMGVLGGGDTAALSSIDTLTAHLDATPTIPTEDLPA